MDNQEKQSRIYNATAHPSDLVFPEVRRSATIAFAKATARLSPTPVDLITPHRNSEPLWASPQSHKFLRQLQIPRSFPREVGRGFMRGCVDLASFCIGYDPAHSPGTHIQKIKAHRQSPVYTSICVANFT